MGFAPTWLRQVSPPLLHKPLRGTEAELYCDRSTYGNRLLPRVTVPNLVTIGQTLCA